MKLVIQIPCYNEREQLPSTFQDLPHAIPGIDEIEVLVIDDGSTDGTSETAEALGVHHIVRFPRNRGLAAAYLAGLEAALRLGADVVVNTDADNQYSGRDIALLVEPIVAERADIVIGDRRTDTLPQFSRVKRLLQRWGSRLVRATSGVDVRDATSGFRALSRRAALMQTVHNRFSYTLETILQAGEAGLAIENIPIHTNGPTRSSRLFASVPSYLRKSLPGLLRAYVLYWPARTFGGIALGLGAVGSVLVTRFLLLYLLNPGYSGHVQSLVVGVGAIVLAFLTGLLAVLADLLGVNRRLLSELLTRVRGLELTATSRPDHSAEPDRSGITHCGHAPWRRDRSGDATPTPDQEMYRVRTR